MSAQTLTSLPKTSAQPSLFAAKSTKMTGKDYNVDIRIAHNKVEALTDAGKAAKISGLSMKLAQDILCRVRPSHDDRSVKFLDDVADWIGEAAQSVFFDAYGNLHAVVVEPDMHPNVMFTSHVDTVVSATCKDEYQTVCYDAKHNVFFKDDGKCLGADDGTGVAIMLEMIQHGVPGHYAFFLDEETGRNGSIAFMGSVHYNPAQYDMVVSFDRANSTDIITKQRGGKCASDTFAQALGSDLKKINGLDYAPCPKGSFTDSATFMDEIAECTNISVGYKYQHSDQEIQNVQVFEKLCEAVTFVNWSLLPIERDPSEKEPEPTFGIKQGGSGFKTSTRKHWADLSYVDKYEDDDDYFRNDPPPSYLDMERFEDMFTPTGELKDMIALCKNYPETVARALNHMGFTTGEIEEAAYEMTWGA